MKKFMLFMLAFVGLAMFSCLSEQSGAPTKPISKDGVLLKFTLPGGELITRSVAAVEGENIVNDMTVLFFKPTTNGTGEFIAAYKVPANLLPDPGAPEQSQFTFEIGSMSGSGLVKADPYSILVFANMKTNMFTTDQEFDNFITLLEGKTENEVMNQTTMHITGVPDNNVEMTGGIEIKNLPMSAQTKKEANVDVVDVQLIRALSRFDVVNATSTHKIMSVSIWNGFTQSMVWEKGYMDYSYARTRRFYGRNFPVGKSMHGGLYSFENVSTSPDQNDDKTTCLILGIQPEGGGAIKYYRVNISPSESGQYLKRNNVYQLTVQKVLGAGEDSEIDAYIKDKILLDVSINSWDRDEDGLIIRDGNNLLAIPTRKARFSPEAETRQYYVYTLGTGTLELIKLDMPTGMDAWLGGATNNDLFISVDAYTFDQRKGSIELRFAGMKGVIEIIQSGVTEKSLKLSHTTIPMYPAGSRTDMVGANPILINSSGPWTAEIYGTDFSFDMGTTPKYKLTGEDGGHINNIYSRAINGNPSSRTNFVLITLDEDPDNYRNVLVLTQAGTGGFTLTPNNTTVAFNADRALSQITGNTNVFKLEPGAPTDTWSAEILTGMNADKFEITVTDATSAGAGKWSGNGTITITAKEINYAGTYNAMVRITHNDSNTKNITVSQDTYSLSTTLTDQDAIPETGGYRDVRISTTASQPLEWKATLTGKATIIAKGLIPYFVGSDGKPIMDGANYATSITGMTPATVRVGMKGIGQDIRALGTPEATIVAALTANASVTTTPITIKQDPVTYYNLYGQTLTATYGRWDIANDHVLLFRNELMSSANFGPVGAKVYTRATPNLAGTPSYTTFNNNTGEKRTRILNANGNDYLNANSTDWGQFRNDPYVVFVMSDHAIFLNKVFNNTGFGGLGFAIHTTNVPVSYQRKITTESKTVDSEIYKFLIGGDGPFGKVDIGSFVINSFDGTNCTLANNAWPATFIPLIRHDLTNNCIVGIDPTLRMIWIGDTEIFTKFSTSQPNNDSQDALRFMNNLQAWMVMTANYGDAFNDRFKIKTP